jgi:hypothetical protein
MKKTIYVALLEEGTTVWRPVEAEQVHEEVFRIVGTVPDDEKWEFSPGELVRCREKAFANEEMVLVAYERVS